MFCTRRVCLLLKVEHFGGHYTYTTGDWYLKANDSLLVYGANEVRYTIQDTRSEVMHCLKFGITQYTELKYVH